MEHTQQNILLNTDNIYIKKMNNCYVKIQCTVHTYEQEKNENRYVMFKLKINTYIEIDRRKVLRFVLS